MIDDRKAGKLKVECGDKSVSEKRSISDAHLRNGCLGILLACPVHLWPNSSCNAEFGCLDCSGAVVGVLDF